MGGDYLVFKEFRVFLQALRQFFEFYQAFEWLDKTQDRRISRQEFTSLSVRSTIEKWVGPIQDWNAEFDGIVGDEGDQVGLNSRNNFIKAHNTFFQGPLLPVC